MRPILSLLFAVPLAAATPGECWRADKLGRKAEARACFTQLAGSSDIAARAEGHYGLRDYRQAHDSFREAVRQQPKNANLRVRWGRMLIEPFNRNKKDAVELFQEALEIDFIDAI